MSARFEELDWQSTPLGELMLRRRTDVSLGVEIFEVKLGEEFLMSSLFTVAEEQLADLGLDLARGDSLSVLVGGLGLGYTAVAALRHRRVTAMTVIDAMPAVIDWHERGLLPVSEGLIRDVRTRFVLGDFFALARREPESAENRYDVILLDVDHSPRHQLNPSHADLYTVPGLHSLTRHLTDGGVFALWSDDPPDKEFVATMAAVFAETQAHVVNFDNPVTGGTSSNTIYVAR